MPSTNPLIKSVFFILLISTGLSAQQNPLQTLSTSDNEQIGQYIVEIFEDSKGNLWFGTMQYGVAIFDGKQLVYFSEKDGLQDNAVTSIAEDKNGTLWFGTQSGLSKYDGNEFVNFSNGEGYASNSISDILIDKSGKFWIATWKGVYIFNGSEFSTFELPLPNVELHSYQQTMHWITDIFEDSKGNLWFGRDGYGATFFNGTQFTHLTKKDGLPSNNVQAIQEDKDGNIWIGTRVAENDHPEEYKRYGRGGLSKFNGETIQNFDTIDGLHHCGIYGIHRDGEGNIWVGTSQFGAYKFSGKEMKNYAKKTNSQMAIQTIMEDSKGVLWFGCSGGLYRLENNQLTNVKQSGSWSD